MFVSIVESIVDNFCEMFSNFDWIVSSLHLNLTFSFPICEGWGELEIVSLDSVLNEGIFSFLFPSVFPAKIIFLVSMFSRFLWKK